MTLDNIPLQEFEFTSVALDGIGEFLESSTHRARKFTVSLAKDVSLEMVAVPGGSFLMGSQVGLSYGHAWQDERPQHRVTVKPFLMGQYPVTQEQWQTLMRSCPSRFQGARRPVEGVAWKDAVRFCERLSKRTGKVFRLPSEAQWEYACRANTATPFCFGPTLTTDVANYNGEFTYQAGPRGVYRHETTEVGSYPPNPFGLFDLHGNVWEWCADAWHASYIGAPADDRIWQVGGEEPYRVARGGCWHDTPDVCRSAARLKLKADEGDEIVGFRVALY